MSVVRNSGFLQVSSRLVPILLSGPMSIHDQVTRSTNNSAAAALLSPTTVLSLSFLSLLVLVAVQLSYRLLPTPVARQTLLLHTWHLFDFLIHTIFEGSYLYHSFFTYAALATPPPPSDYPHPASVKSNGVAFLGHAERTYGAAHSTHPTALLWQEYARADTRWARTDTNIISIELLTVFVAGPLALYICFLLQHQHRKGDASPWFCMTVLATGEIYGGFMTFAPEWMTGNAHLNTGNWMHLWLYLVLFNGLWVAIPGWVLWVAYGELTEAGRRQEEVEGSRKHR
ncbi:MAG: hypothetical protein Q9202_002969 [Teloschistes flavicans]